MSTSAICIYYTLNVNDIFYKYTIMWYINTNLYVINNIALAPCVGYACYQCIYYSLSYHFYIIIFN